MLNERGPMLERCLCHVFEEIQEVFLADIQAEVVMNDIPHHLIFNWDQTGIQTVLTGQWTMNRAKEKLIPIAHSDYR